MTDLSIPESFAAHLQEQTIRTYGGPHHPVDKLWLLHDLIRHEAVPHDLLTSWGAWSPAFDPLTGDRCHRFLPVTAITVPPAWLAGQGGCADLFRAVRINDVLHLPNTRTTAVDVVRWLTAASAAALTPRSENAPQLSRALRLCLPSFPPDISNALPKIRIPLAALVIHSAIDCLPLAAIFEAHGDTLEYLSVTSSTVVLPSFTHSMPALKHLVIKGARITRSLLQSLASCPALERLELSRSEWSCCTGTAAAASASSKVAVAVDSSSVGISNLFGTDSDSDSSADPVARAKPKRKQLFGSDSSDSDSFSSANPKAPRLKPTSARPSGDSESDRPAHSLPKRAGPSPLIPFDDLPLLSHLTLAPIPETRWQAMAGLVAELRFATLDVRVKAARGLFDSSDYSSDDDDNSKANVARAQRGALKTVVTRKASVLDATWLADLPTVRCLELNEPSLSVFPVLTGALPTLTALCLFNVSHLSNNAFIDFFVLDKKGRLATPSLTSLTVSGCDVTGGAVFAVAALLPQLEMLGLQSLPIFGSITREVEETNEPCPMPRRTGRLIYDEQRSASIASMSFARHPESTDEGHAGQVGQEAQRAREYVRLPQRLRCLVVSDCGGARPFARNGEFTDLIKTAPPTLLYLAVRHSPGFIAGPVIRSLPDVVPQLLRLDVTKSTAIANAGDPFMQRKLLEVLVALPAKMPMLAPPAIVPDSDVWQRSALSYSA